MTPNDSTTVTFSQVYNDVKGALSGMADALKVGAEHVYEVLVRQQIVNSITYLILLSVSLIFVYIFYKGVTNKDEKWSDYGDPTAYGIFRFSCLIIGLIALSISLINIDVIVMGLINPEYGAIMEIKSFIR